MRYIIYEVCRETGKFFVMTIVSYGRAAFRIVDCAYDKRFLVPVEKISQRPSDCQELQTS